MNTITLSRAACPNQSSLEALGFRIDSSDSKCKLRLPNGWSLVTSTQTIYIIMDDKNRKRGHSFLGPSLYETTKLELLTKYKVVTRRVSDTDRFSPINVYVEDYDGSFSYFIGSCGNLNSEAYKQLLKDAEGYLNRVFPEWENPTKYWD